MNEETISALGEFAQRLLGSDHFKALTALFAQQCAADMLSTKPDDAKGREQIFAAHLGFSNFIALVEKFAEAHEHDNTPQQPQDTTDDPSVHDIYGID